MSGDPTCPYCGNFLSVKKRRSDGHLFLGCMSYPQCDYTTNMPKKSPAEKAVGAAKDNFIASLSHAVVKGRLTVGETKMKLRERKQTGFESSKLVVFDGRATRKKDVARQLKLDLEPPSFRRRRA